MVTKIRSANASDAPAIARVYVGSWKATYPGIVPQLYLDSLNELEATALWHRRIEDEPAMSIHVAETDGVLCGFISGGRLRRPEGSYNAEIYAIYLLGSVQGIGIGRKLFASMAMELARQELRNLLVWVLLENPATAFYKRLGGIVVTQGTLEIGGKKLATIAFGCLTRYLTPNHYGY